LGMKVQPEVPTGFGAGVLAHVFESSLLPNKCARRNSGVFDQIGVFRKRQGCAEGRRLRDNFFRRRKTARWNARTDEDCHGFPRRGRVDADTVVRR